MKDKRRTKKRRDQKNRRREKLNKSNESERIERGEVEGCRAEEDSEKSNEIRGEIRRGEKTRNT